MFFIKKLLLGLTAIILIFVGGSGTQSSNLLMQGGGFIGMVVGFVVLYLFAKIVWRAMGCLPSLLIICAVVGFVLYAIGAFNGGVGNIIPNIKSFLGAERGAKISLSDTETENYAAEQEDDLPPSAPPLEENFTADPLTENLQTAAAAEKKLPEPAAEAATAAARPAVRQPEQSDAESGLSKLVSSLTGKKNPEAKMQNNYNPNDYPAIRGVARVINGDTLEMNGHYFKIYAIDAPEANQTCSDAKGRPYYCGKEAANWLKSWISGYEIECHVLQRDKRGNMVGTCALGQYDIGAALVNAGWAVAYTKVSSVYEPYERQAQQNGRGLWQGQFYKPWDWREIKSKKPKIKVIQPKGAKRGFFDF